MEKTPEEFFDEIYSEGFNNSPIALKLAFKEACSKVAFAYGDQIANIQNKENLKLKSQLDIIHHHISIIQN